MTADIILVLIILLIAVGLFIAERLRVDLVALLVLGSLAVTGLVSPAQAVSGFSNPAVVTVWAVFILSGALSRTGIANMLGKQVLRLAGDSEIRLLAVLMIAAGVMSAFMNNIGVAAMFLPVILDISRQTGRPPSKLLLPLVYGTLLGGMTTLISTPTNILISDALWDVGLTPFGLFDYTPAGVAMLLAGTLFMVLLGRSLLPAHHPVKALAIHDGRNGHELYGLEERLALIDLPRDSLLAGHTLAGSRIGLALGLNILGIYRNGLKQMAPRPETILQGGDRLLVVGRLDRLRDLSRRPLFILESDPVAAGQLVSEQIGLAEFRVPADYEFIGQTLAQLNLRHQSGLNVLAIQRDIRAHRTNLQAIPLQAGDRLLVQATRNTLEALATLPEFQLLDDTAAAAYGIQERLLAVRIPDGSPLVGRSLLESRLGRTFGLSALGVIREGWRNLLPDPNTELQANDVLIIGGHPDDLAVIRGLPDLVVEPEPAVDLHDLETETAGLIEAVVSPYTSLDNKTLRELNFREKYGLNVLAIWRGRRAHRSNLNDMALRFGDGLLLYGPRERIRQLGREQDFLVLEEAAQEVPRSHKALPAALIMLGVIGIVIAGWLPIAIAAIIGAALMVLTGCLEMDEAYRYIEWKAVFLIAGMLPLGIAMEETGAARFLAEIVVVVVGGFGPSAILAGLFGLSLLATQFMPNPVVAVLMAPIALSTAADLEISPYPLLMAIAFAASSSFLSPVGHPANVLVMSPGGYRFADYLRVGLPLALVLLLMTVLVVPWLWPF